MGTTMKAPWGAYEMDIEDVPGAWPRGTRVRKTNSEEGDIMPTGAVGTVLGSFGPLPYTPERPDLTGSYAYAVEWDGSPNPPSFITERKLQREG